MARGSITRSSAAAALVVTALLAVVLWERNVRPGTERSTSALHPPRRDPATGEPEPVAAHPGEPMKGRSVTRTGAKESEPGAAQDGLLAPLGTTPSPDGGAAPRRR